MEARSEHARVARTSLHALAPIRMLGRCLSTKVAASEAQSEVHQECVVGWVSLLCLLCVNPMERGTQ